MKMRTISRTTIGWCTHVWNPVWGCLNNCAYCYAKKIAKRFAKQIAKNHLNYMLSGFPSHGLSDKVIKETLGNLTKNLRDFKPVFLRSLFDKDFPKKPARIFVGSMSEVAHWQENWMKDVLRKIRRYPQHTFIFLTKDPQIYNNYDFPRNCWLGWTITKMSDIRKYFFEMENKSFYIKEPNKNNIFFASFEPLHGPIHYDIKIFDWVIIGSETGNRKGKIVPKFIEFIYIQALCMKYGIPIYMKDNLLEPFPLLKLKHEWPESVKAFKSESVEADVGVIGGYDHINYIKRYPEANFDYEKPEDKE